MVDEGWNWRIIPWGIDVAFPSFAFHAQKALNSSNHVANLVSELETAVSLSITLDDVGMQAKANAADKKTWESMALSNVAAACMPCASYAKVIMQYVQCFSGGHGAPMIKFMDLVTKQFQCSVPLGESFWTAITNANFHSKSC